MKTITLKCGNIYEMTKNGYYYATIGGKKIRVSRAAWEMAQEEAKKEALEKMNREQNECNEFVEITEEDIDKAIEEAQESETTEEIEEIQKELAPKKAKKTRKSKNAFHTSIAVPGLTLTDKQTEFMLHLNDTNFWENGLDSVIWVDVLCDEIGGQFRNKPMTVGAMISTLCEKGLGRRATERKNGKKCTSFELTETGKLVAKELGLC